MKRTNIHLLLWIITIISFSCGQENFDSLVLTDGGSLSVQLKSSDGAAVPEAKVKLYGIEDNVFYQQIVTDLNGVANFGDYNSGSYYLIISANVNDAKYQFRQATQVISGVNKNLVLDLADYEVAVDVTIKGDFTKELFESSGYSVVLILYSDYTDNQDTAVGEWENSFTEEVVDGKAFFEGVPVGYYIGLLINDEGSPIELKEIRLEQFENEKVSIFVNEIALNLLRKQFSITSMENANNSKPVVHTHKSIKFSVNNKFVLTDYDDTVAQGSYYISNSSNGSVRINFNWDYMSVWGSAIYSVDGSSILLTTTYYNTYEDVVIQLE